MMVINKKVKGMFCQCSYMIYDNAIQETYYITISDEFVLLITVLYGRPEAC